MITIEPMLGVAGYQGYRITETTCKWQYHFFPGLHESLSNNGEQGRIKGGIRSPRLNIPFGTKLSLGYIIDEVTRLLEIAEADKSFNMRVD